MKRIIAMLLAVVLCIALLPAAATAEETVLAEGDTAHRVHWTLCTDGTLYLDPNDRYGYLVKDENPWKGYNDRITALVIEVGDYLNYIPERMFEGMPCLRTLRVNGSLQEIEKYAFFECYALEEVTIHGDLGGFDGSAFWGGVGDGAFFDCNKLARFTVDGAIAQIKIGGFRNCNLSEFTIPVYGDVGGFAFDRNRKLTAIFPIRGSLGNFAFSDTNLENGRGVFIVSGHSGTLDVGALPDDAPAYYTGTEAEFAERYNNNRGANITAYQKIGNNVTWTLEDGVLTIDGYGPTIDLLDQSEQPWANIPGRTWDENREQITKVRIKNGVVPGAHLLDYLESKVEYFDFERGGTVGNLEWSLRSGILAVGGTGEIPNLYGEDSAAWMPYRDEFWEVFLGEGITAVGFAAFNNCARLERVRFADGVKRIDGAAFYGCGMLDAVSLPEHLTTIGRNAFTDCKNLKTIYIPASVTSIGSQAFDGTGLTDIYYGGRTEEWNALHVSGVGNAFVHMSATGLTPGAVVLPPNTGAFTDVSGDDWFAEDAAFVYNAGYMRGTSDTEFSPALTTDRATAATVLHRMAGTPEAAAAAFRDVEKESWYEQAVNWAAESGVTNGVSTGRFAPHASLTREQLVTFLYRFAQNDLAVEAVDEMTLSAFADAKAVSPWAADAMTWAVAAGIIKGTDKGEINPAGTASRAEFAAMLHRFAQWKQHEILGKEE